MIIIMVRNNNKNDDNANNNKYVILRMMNYIIHDNDNKNENSRRNIISNTRSPVTQTRTVRPINSKTTRTGTLRPPPIIINLVYVPRTGERNNCFERKGRVHGSGWRVYTVQDDACLPRVHTAGAESEHTHTHTHQRAIRALPAGCNHSQ